MVGQGSSGQDTGNGHSLTGIGPRSAEASNTPQNNSSHGNAPSRAINGNGSGNGTPAAQLPGYSRACGGGGRAGGGGGSGGSSGDGNGRHGASVTHPLTKPQADAPGRLESTPQEPATGSGQS
jgi:hypothetical protein